MEFSGSLTDVTKEYILKRVSEEAIMQHYLGVPVRIGQMFRSPLRKDDNPTCMFSYHKGRLKYRDWAEPISKDCFDVVMERFGCSYNEALQIIARDFNVVKLDVDPNIEKRKKKIIEREKKYGGKSTIQVKRQEFTPVDADYLRRFGINREICKKFKCFSIKYLWINQRRHHIYTEHDPMLGYYFGRGENGEERWKIYFYKRGHEIKKPRFIGNTNRINGWVQIPEEGNHLVLTKSMKDVMSLYRLGVDAIAMQNETTEPYPRIIEEIQERFDHLFSLYDFDAPGIHMANKLKKKYNITPVFLTNGRFGTPDMGSKDISDFIRDAGLGRAKKMVEFIRSKHGIGK